MRKLMSPGLLGATALGALIVASAMGIRLDAKAFFVNVLAGIACPVLGVATALVLVDRYVAYKRRKQWEGVEAVTLNAIAVHLCEITGSMFLHFRMPFG